MTDTGAVTKVLVTGAYGFIAAHIIHCLQKNGIKVRGTIRQKDSDNAVALHKIFPELELVEADFFDGSCWERTMEGCSHVIHTASNRAFSWQDEHDDERAIIEQGIEGTMNVIKACSATPAIKRVVLTSTIFTVSNFINSKKCSEKDWADLSKCSTYIKSKFHAEKVAWEYVNALEGDKKFELAVINPGFVLGPHLTQSPGLSAVIIADVIMRKNNRVPHTTMPLCDVRDVAAAHINALTFAEAAGNRHIIVSEFVFCDKIGKILADEFKPQGYNPTTTVASWALLKVLSLFNPTIKDMINSWDINPEADTTRMHESLSITPIPIHDTIIDMAYSLIENEFIPKTKQFKSRDTAVK